MAQLYLKAMHLRGTGVIVWIAHSTVAGVAAGAPHPEEGVLEDVLDAIGMRAEKMSGRRTDQLAWKSVSSVHRRRRGQQWPFQ